MIPWEVGSSELDPVTTECRFRHKIAVRRLVRRQSTSAITRRPLVRQGEEIVCASGDGGGTRSSDLHEWRNDLGAVSTRDPVKL